MTKRLREQHGLSGTLQYRIWNSMIQRCTNVQNPAYARYGGRGIAVCERWMQSFEVFYSDMGDRPKGMTLDRVDTDGDYEPGNCRWATAKEQARNTRSNRMLSFRGESKCLQEWSDAIGIDKSSLRERLDAGWSVERALTEPIRYSHKLLSYKGQSKTAAEWADGIGLSRTTFASRLKYGWTLERIIETPARNYGRAR